MPTLLRAARLLTPSEEMRPGSLLMEREKIIALGADVAVPEAAIVDLGDATLVPGFVDIHVHGGGGFSLSTDNGGEIESYAGWVTARGVTSFLPTIFAATAEEAMRYLRTAAQAVSESQPGRAELLGLNLEGPFVNRLRSGALPPTWPLLPDRRMLDGLLQAAGDKLRLMTIAPELGGAGQIIRTCLQREVAISLGHSDAGYQDAAVAFAAGASHVTHAFNAMRPYHHRHPGIIGAALEAEGTTIEVIADGVHLHPATLRMMFQAFGLERIALVTDGVAPAGLEAGSFRTGDEEARLEGGRVLLADGTIAGSAATMDAVVRNVVGWGIASLADVVQMASTVPARVAGVGRRKGRLAAGYDADVVALSSGLEVTATWTRGVRTSPVDA